MDTANKPFYPDEETLKRLHALMQSQRRDLWSARLSRLGHTLNGLHVQGTQALSVASEKAALKVQDLRKVRTLDEVALATLAKAKLAMEAKVAKGIPVTHEEVEKLKDHVFDTHLTLSDRALKGIVEAEPDLLKIDMHSLETIPLAAAHREALDEFVVYQAPGGSWADLRMQKKELFEKIFPNVRDFSDLVVEVVHSKLAPQIDSGIDELASRALNIQAKQVEDLEADRWAKGAQGWLGRRLSHHGVASPLPRPSRMTALKSRLGVYKPTLEELEALHQVKNAEQGPPQLSLDDAFIAAETVEDMLARDERQVGERVIGLNS
jgi:hypothetical protein